MYLTIITTVLVITQLIRIAQNHISLRKQEKLIERDAKWVKDTEITKEDFEVQREVFYMLHKKLSKEEEE